MAILIKISEDNYRMLSGLSGRLREELGKPVSLNEAISFLAKKNKLSNFAGKLNMSDLEISAFKKDLNGMWSKWTKRYA